MLSVLQAKHAICFEVTFVSIRHLNAVIFCVGEQPSTFCKAKDFRTDNIYKQNKKIKK